MTVARAGAFGSAFNRPRRAVSHNATFKAFHDHVVAGYVEGHAIEIVLDPLKRPQQTLGDFHEFGFAISNSELREVRHDIVSQNVENGGIATVDFPEIVGGDGDALLGQLCIRHSMNS